MGMPTVERAIPALLVRTGQRVWDYGGLATVRTLGRLGIEVFAQAHPGERELLASRYLTGIVGNPLDPLADTAKQIEHLNASVAAVGVPCVAFAGDDESAVLIAEQRQSIDRRLLSAAMPPHLPRTLSDKVLLGGLAADAGVPYPRFVVSKDIAVLQAFVEEAGLPLILKSPAPYVRLNDATVSRTTVVRDRSGLNQWLPAAEAGHEIFMQQYLAGPGTQGWYASGVSAGGGQTIRVWTGRKLVSHPAGTGIGVINVGTSNTRLAQTVQALCRKIGYEGPFDTDWIVDPSAGTAYLIDFNPRRGAQFRTFQTVGGLDPVRAAHMAATGVPLPVDIQISGLVHTVENLALLQGVKAMPWRYRTTDAPIEYSWFARDDMAPARSMLSQTGRSAVRKARRRLPGG